MPYLGSLSLKALLVAIMLATGGARVANANCPGEESLRSKEGKISTAITFLNQGSVPVSIYWVDYQGNRKFYSKLEPGQRYRQQTFITHPWIVTSEGNDCLRMFMPQATEIVAAVAPIISASRGSNDSGTVQRQDIKSVIPQITIPNPALAEQASSAMGRRIALVVGNSNYASVPALPNPQRDAALVADTLKQVGFETVTLQTNLGREALDNALRAFARQAEAADWALVYYAGHGMEVNGTNYLIPIDARILSDRDISLEAVSLDQVRDVVNRATRLRLIILDACRDNPFASQMKRTMTVASRSVSRGLASVEPEAGTLIVYAAKDGETAADGAGINSPFATAFVKNVQRPGLEVRRLFDYVRDDVMDATGKKQQPFSYGSLSGRDDFYFVAAK